MCAAALWLGGCGGSSTTPSTTPSASASASSSAPAAPPSPPSLRRYYAQQLNWHSCAASFQCSTLTVPVDYAHPTGSTLHLAVIRKRSAGSRRGSLIVNPGGPGASGVQYVEQAAASFSSLTDHYDLVSFDPRGVGASHPVRCVTSAQLDAFVGADPMPQGSAAFRAFERQSRQFAEDCERRNGSFLKHVSTLDEARDLDVLRAALGDAKLTYYGASYGTYLGTKYAQLFPTHIRAMVLDGALDPDQSTIAEGLDQAKGFEGDLDDFLSNCAAQAGCPLGATEAAGLHTVEALSARIRAHPEPVGARQLTAGTFFEGLAAALYSPSTWGLLRDALVGVTEGDGSAMLALSDALSERNADGSYSNLIEANFAINCIDRPSPRQPSAYVAAARQATRVAPVFGGPIIDGSLICAYWPVPPVEQPHPVAAPGAPPILVIGTTRDPATPYIWAKALASQLTSGVLLTYDGDGHTAFDRGDACVVGAVKAYVEQLKPPHAGITCH